MQNATGQNEDPHTRVKAWLDQFMIPVRSGVSRPGDALLRAWPRFAVWLLMDREEGAIRFIPVGTPEHDRVARIASMWQRVVNGESVELLEGEFCTAMSSSPDRFVDLTSATPRANTTYRHVTDTVLCADSVASCLASSALADMYEDHFADDEDEDDEDDDNPSEPPESPYEAYADSISTAAETFYWSACEAAGIRIYGHLDPSVTVGVTARDLALGRIIDKLAELMGVRSE